MLCDKNTVNYAEIVIVSQIKEMLLSWKKTKENPQNQIAKNENVTTE